MHIRSFSLKVFAIIALASLAAGAQPADWDAVALAHPRSLYPDAELPQIRSYISGNATAEGIYARLYANAEQTSDNQRQRARIAKNAAFVLSIGFDDQHAPLSGAQSDALRTIAVQYLQEIDPTVQSSTGEQQWRAIELQQFSQAYDLLRGTGLAPDTMIENRLYSFAENAHDRFRSPILGRNNITMKLAASMGMAAIVLHESSNNEIRIRTGAWLETALEHIAEAMFEYQAGLGGYSEGPYYFRYAMVSLLPFFRALDIYTAGASELIVEANIYPSPLHDERYVPLYDWITGIRLPDGRLPAWEDTYMDNRFPELAVLSQYGPANPRYNWLQTSDGSPLTASGIVSAITETYDFTAEYLSARVPPSIQATPGHLTYVSPDAGYIAVRSDEGPDATYFGMIGKHSKARTGGSQFGSGHKHANETGFMLASGGKILATEPGYYQYAHRDSLIYGKNHNIVLVDGKGPEDASFLNFLYGADTYITDTLTSGSTLIATLHTNYENTDVQREVIVVNGDIIVMRDSLISTTQRTFTHQVHGMGLESADTFDHDYARHTGRWTNGDRAMTAFVNSFTSEAVHETAVRKHAPQYEEFEDHSAMYTHTEGNAASFFSVLLPQTDTLQLESRHEDGENNAWHAFETLPSTFSRGALAVSQNGGPPSQPSRLIGGMYAYSNTHDGNWIAATHCSLIHTWEVGFSLMELDKRMNIIIHDLGRRYVVAGTVDAPAELQINSMVYPEYVVGTGIDGWSKAPWGNQPFIKITEDRFEFELYLSENPIDVEEVPAAGAFSIQGPYPSPVHVSTNFATIVLSAAPNTAYTIALHNAMGQELHRQRIEITSRSPRSVEIPTANLSAGMYFVRTIGPADTKTVKLVVAD